MRVFVVLAFFFGTHYLNGQDVSKGPRIDSLNRALENAKAISVKVEILSALLNEYLYTDANEARKIAKKSIRIAEESKDLPSLLKSLNNYADLLYYQGSYDSSILMFKKNLPSAKEHDLHDLYSEALIGIGNNYWRKGAYPEAREYFEKNIEFCEQNNEPDGIASSYNNLGNICNDMGDYANALTYYIKSFEQYKALGLEQNSAIALANIGMIKSRLEEYESARNYYQQSVKIFEKLGFQLGINFVFKNLGIIYKRLENYDSALICFNTAIASYEKMGERFEITQLTINIGNIYYLLEDFDKAESSYTKALLISQEISDSLDICGSYRALGNLYYKKNNYTKSKYYLIAASSMARKLMIPSEVIEAEKTLAELYEREGDFKNAYKSTYTYAVLRDSIFNSEKKKLAVEIEAKYKTEQSAQEIELLKSKNEIQSIQIGNRERERYYLIALAVSVLILVVVLYNRYTLKNKAHQKLKELDKIKSTFFANISHEFRTPLTLISGSLEDLSGNASNNEDQARLEIMRKNTKRLRQLIEQLLDLSRLESGRLKLNVTPINSNNFLNAITSSFSSWATQKNILLSVDLPEESMIMYADEDVLEKIINNLLSNAIKFTPPHGTVRFSSECNSEELKIQVSDDGPGIPESKINQIFERFYQMDDSSTRKHEGSGIGLALVKELVSLHHGQVSVMSHPNAGAVFNFTIPIHKKFYASSETGTNQNGHLKISNENIELATPQEYPEYIEPAGNNPIILVVEDNVDLGHYIGDHLPNHTIILAYNGVDGFQKATQHIPDLIISDVMMPEMDGVEFCKKIKEEETTSHIPVILLTAKADIESRLEGLETGADDYMTKPFDARELQTRVKNLIQQREKLRERFSRTVILKPKDIAITPPDEVFLEKVMAIIEDHLGDSEFTADDFQKEIGMSRMQLYRKLKALTGHSANDFIRIQRLIRASELLANGQGNISEVCYQTGFSSLSYFDRCFKKQFEVTPKEYILLHSKSE